MLDMSRSQKANSYQVVIGMFLLASGSETTTIPVWNSFTNSGTPLGALPLHMKPPRTTTFPVIDRSNILLSPRRQRNWAGVRLKAALGECPTVDQIAVHLTEQYPVPAMQEDESSMEGTSHVYTRILQSLGITNADLRAHVLMFNNGDLLTDSLVDKIESAHRNSVGEIEMKVTIRRFGLLHAKMASCRLVVNEHWQAKLDLAEEPLVGAHSPVEAHIDRYNSVLK
ncbi:hypothetical protein C8R46DRAFT_1037148 [Mycena filopes]|nr:hypothetical protein C8R46DRAFT_1037148 [Mycena filopes]